MSPSQAIWALRDRGWTISAIAKEVGLHRSNVYLSACDASVPRHETAMKLINLAKSGRKPKERK